MAARNAMCSISMILRKNRGLWTVYEYESYEAFFVSNIFKETETDIQPLPQKIKIQRFIIELVDYYTTFWLNIYSAKTKTK